MIKIFVDAVRQKQLEGKHREGKHHGGKHHG